MSDRTEVEIKDGIKYTTYYIDRPIRQGDLHRRSIGKRIDGEEILTEVINYVYKASEEPNIMQYPITPDPTNITTLLHLSGGMDSTYVAYHWLKSHPNETLLIHHILLKNKIENRLNEEKSAVTKILKYFKDNNITNFHYEESSFDYGTLPRISLRDIQIVAVFTAIILHTKAFNSINTLLIPFHKYEMTDTIRASKVIKVLEALNCSNKISIQYPLQYMDKKDMADTMPTELLQLCASCRRPKNGKHCGHCHTCKELKKYNIFHNFI